MEESDICQEEMKRNVNSEYFKHVRSTLKSKLNTGNIPQAFNIWAVATTWYGAGIILWTKKELQKMDRKTIRLITIYEGLHSRSCIDRLYIPWSGGGSGLVSVQDCVKEEKCNL